MTEFNTYQHAAGLNRRWNLPSLRAWAVAFVAVTAFWACVAAAAAWAMGV